jgi:hypothetical protein
VVVAAARNTQIFILLSGNLEGLAAAAEIMVTVQIWACPEVTGFLCRGIKVGLRLMGQPAVAVVVARRLLAQMALLILVALVALELQVQSLVPL